jgi:hypothetical protein
MIELGGRGGWTTVGTGKVDGDSRLHLGERVERRENERKER